MRDATPGGSRAGTREDWWASAACADVADPELFFPGPSEPAPDEALAACRRCPVRAECLEWALAHDERFGIWGGLTEAERRAVAQLQQAAADPGQRVPGLSPRGAGRWAVQVYVRRPDGRKGQLGTTVHGSRAQALAELARLRERAAQAAVVESDSGQEVA